MKEWLLGGLSEAWALPLDWAFTEPVHWFLKTNSWEWWPAGLPRMGNCRKWSPLDHRRVGPRLSSAKPGSWVGLWLANAYAQRQTSTDPSGLCTFSLGDVSCWLTWEIAGQPKPEVFWANALGNWQHLFGLSCVLCCNIRVSFCHALPWSFPFVRVQRSLRNGMLPEKVFCAWRAKARERPVTPSKRATSDTKHQLPVFQVYVRVVDDMVVDKFTQSGWSHSLARRIRRKELLSFVLENRLGIPHI